MAKMEETKKHDSAKPKHEVKAPEVKVQVLKQKQKVMDLETFQDAEIELVYDKYQLPDYDPKVNGTEEDFNAALLADAESKVAPITKRITALYRFAESENYQNAKVKALSGGNYLTPQIKNAAAVILQSMAAFAELGKSEVLERWINGLKKNSAGALKILDQAKTATSTEDVDF